MWAAQSTHGFLLRHVLDLLRHVIYYRIVRMPNAHQIKILQGNLPARISMGKDALTNQKNDSRGRISEAYMPERKIHGCEPPSEKVCKNNRTWKRCMLDGAFDEADEDDEIRHLEKLTTAKSSVHYGSEFGDDGEEENKKQKTSKVSKRKKKDRAEYDDVLMLKNMLYQELARMVRNQN